MSDKSFLSTVFDGTVVDGRKPSAIYSGNITRPNIQLQLRELQPSGPSVVSDNSNTHLITNKKKHRTSAHRETFFLPQD